MWRSKEHSGSATLQFCRGRAWNWCPTTGPKCNMFPFLYQGGRIAHGIHNPISMVEMRRKYTRTLQREVLGTIVSTVVERKDAVGHCTRATQRPIKPSENAALSL
eukprot:11949912-Ditylum_brightwellii.AAC.1